MKKAIIPVVLLIILATFCSAAVVFEDDVKDNVPFFINDVRHVAKYYPAADKLSLSVGEDRLLIPKGDCDTKNDMQYCVETVETGYNEETGAPISTVRLKVSEFGPEVEIERDFSSTKPTINDEVKVTVTLTNVGTEKAYSVTFEDKYPSDVKLSGAVADLVFNQASWSGNIDAGKSESFTYTLKFTSFSDFKSKASANYPAKNKIKTAYSDEKEFIVQRPYEFSTNMSAASFGSGDDIDYSVTISNEGTEEFNADLSINLPSGFSVVQRDKEITGTEPTLKFEDKISAGEDKVLMIKVKTSKKGEHEITSDLKMKSTSYDFKDTRSNKFKVGVSEVEASVNIEPSEIKSGGEYNIEVKIQNVGSEDLVIDRIDFKSNYSDSRGWRNTELGPGKKFYALNKIQYAPITYENVDYYWTIEGAYKNAAGKSFTFSGTGTLSVLPFEKVVNFTEDHFVVNETATERYVNVTLLIKNIKDYEMTELNVIDGLPKGARMVAGQRDFELDKLSPGQEVVAYSYVMKLPKDSESFEVTHTFNALNTDGEKLIFELPVKIDLEKTKSTLEIPDSVKTEEDNKTEEVTVTEDKNIIEEKKPGIFKRMWSWFTGLFSGGDKTEEVAPQENKTDEATEQPGEKMT